MTIYAIAASLRAAKEAIARAELALVDLGDRKTDDMGHATQCWWCSAKLVQTKGAGAPRKYCSAQCHAARRKLLRREART